MHKLLIENTIIHNVLSRLKYISDFEQFKNTYESLIYKLPNEVIINIKQLEKLLYKKNSIEIIHTYDMGIRKSYDYSLSTLLGQDIDQNAELIILYNDFNYCNLANEIKKVTERLYSDKNEFFKKRIDLLLELYSFCNYELLKIAFKLGYIANISNSVTAIQDSNSKQTLKISIGKKLNYCRTSAKLTQNHLSSLFNLDRSVISNYERGISIPSLSILLLYSKYFFVNISDIVDTSFTLEMFKDKYSFNIYNVS